MNELKVFENAEFGQIRGVEINGESWLVGKDVAGRLRGQERIRAIPAQRLMQSALRVKADLYASKRLCRRNSGGRRKLQQEEEQKKKKK